MVNGEMLMRSTVVSSVVLLKRLSSGAFWRLARWNLDASEQSPDDLQRFLLQVFYAFLLLTLSYCFVYQLLLFPIILHTQSLRLQTQYRHIFLGTHTWQ